MRALLALLALVGLLLSPIAASAATQVCLHHHDAAAVAQSMDMAKTPSSGQAMPCCDDDGGKPVKHDSQSCAQACAAVCGAPVALSEPVAGLALSVTHARLEPAAPSPLHAHGPPGLKRPPKHQA